MPISKQSRPCDYLDEYGETVYDFSCFVESDVAYSINAPTLVTVAERDKALLTFKEDMQNYLSGLSEEEIASGDIKKMLKTKSAELAASLSTENMKLSPCDIYMIDICHNGTAITAALSSQRTGQFPFSRILRRGIWTDSPQALRR